MGVCCTHSDRHLSQSENGAQSGFRANAGGSARRPCFLKQTRKLATKFHGLIKFP
jgi:hypothetical protein